MGKHLPRIRQVTRTAAQFVKSTKPVVKEESGRIKIHQGLAKGMESSSNNSNTTGSSNNSRLPLSEVVSECVKRWFKDTLKEAKAGDINMQVLVGQMYYSGYGVPRDAQKGRVWMTRASRIRSSVWKVSDKRPGYNASDSDSEEIKDES